jgi:hypothetical protein
MQYRIYTLSPSGRVLFGTDAQCESEEAAFLVAGENLPFGRQAEVWLGSVCLAVVTGAKNGPLVRPVRSARGLPVRISEPV